MIRAFALSLLLTTSSLAYAERFEATSEVAQVDLYPDGVVVGRQAQLELPAGEHELVLTALPQSWDVRTLGIQLFADVPGIELRAYQIDMNAENAAATAQITALEAEIDALGEDVTAKRATVATARAELDLVENFLEAPALFAERADALEFWAHLTARHAALTPEIDAAGAEIEDLQAQQQELRDQIAELRQTATEAQVTLNLTLESAGEVAIAASYFSSHGGWAPSYIVELDAADGEAKGEVRLTQQAEIWQTTGEDWDGASAALHSTFANASLIAPMGWPHEVFPGGKASFLSAIGSGSYEEEWQPAYADEAPSLEEAMVLSRNLAPVQAQEQVRALQAGFASTYELAHPLTLASEAGQGQTQVLQVATAPADLWVQSVAAQDSRGMLMAGFEAPLSAVTLPGYAKFFRDGSFVGRATLTAMQPGEALELPFGIDTLTTITRNETHDQEGGSGFIGRRETLERTVETSVVSGHSFPMPYRLIEAQPVARHEDIEVNILRTSDAFDELDLEGLEGVNAWRFTLDPNEETSRTLAYQINWPEDMDVNGL